MIKIQFHDGGFAADIQMFEEDEAHDALDFLHSYSCGAHFSKVWFGNTGAAGFSIINKDGTKITVEWGKKDE